MCKYLHSQAHLVWVWYFNLCPKLGIAESSVLNLSRSVLESLNAHIQTPMQTGLSNKSQAPQSPNQLVWTSWSLQ